MQVRRTSKAPAIATACPHRHSRDRRSCAAPAREAATRLLISGLLLVMVGCDSMKERTQAAEDGFFIHIPVDEREAVTAQATPPPVSGGTLLVLEDGDTTLAADPGRDRISVVSLASARLLNTIELENGDQPGRLIESTNGTVHVVLRGARALFSLHIASGRTHRLPDLCAAPRGLAYAPEPRQLHVACKSGELLTISLDDSSMPSEDQRPASVFVEPDLRDLHVRGDELVVSRFKSAELLTLARDTVTVTGRKTPAATFDFAKASDANHPFEISLHGGEDTPLLEASTLWRARATQDGATLLVHQRSSNSEIDLDVRPSIDGGGSYGASEDPDFGCGGIVQTSLTVMQPDGRQHLIGGVPGSVLPVDAAMSPDGSWVAIANAGMADSETPQREVFRADDHGEAEPFFGDFPPRVGPSSSSAAPKASVTLVHTRSLEAVLTQPDAQPELPFHNCAPPEHLGGLPDTPATAVAFAPQPTSSRNGLFSRSVLVVQTREPAMILVSNGTDSPVGIDLGGDSRLDTGHELFHRDVGAGLACASCHAEGGEDGRAWQFKGLGPRRTQSLDVGLADMAPFHWDGTLPDVNALLEDVMVTRMGGAHQDVQRVGALERWLFALPRPRPMVPSESQAAQRGALLFASSALRCMSCHGASGTPSRENFDVGTGEDLQVPSLRGIGYRAPFMHDGCASTLDQRFMESCGGGDDHGQTSQLDAAQRTDLIAYLRSL